MVQFQLHILLRVHKWANFASFWIFIDFVNAVRFGTLMGLKVNTLAHIYKSSQKTKEYNNGIHGVGNEPLFLYTIDYIYRFLFVVRSNKTSKQRIFGLWNEKFICCLFCLMRTRSESAISTQKHGIELKTDSNYWLITTELKKQIWF